MAVASTPLQNFGHSFISHIVTVSTVYMCIQIMNNTPDGVLTAAILRQHKYYDDGCCKGCCIPGKLIFKEEILFKKCVFFIASLH